MIYFQTKNPNLGKFWRIFQMEDVGICVLWPFGKFSVHLVNVVAIWDIVWSFGTFFPFWYVVPRKIWQPCICTIDSEN
jgi:hypothetical protein